ncbi:MAG: rRNA methyltransferase [Treponema sp.]|nr:rRNA methyltransferase [Treponema sp.]
MNVFEPLSREARRMLDGLPALVDKTFPLPARFRSGLPSDVAELSRLLTSGRGERALSYMSRPAHLSAYLRYFMPWNVYRLCRLLPALDIRLSPGDSVTDLGCGPLVFVCALWISRPELRALPLEFNCVDMSAPALDAGKKIFAALAGEAAPWKIRALRADFTRERPRSRAALVCAANAFNETRGDVSRLGSQEIALSARKSAGLLESHAASGASILVVEPGFPRCGEFIAALRAALIERGLRPASPCAHDEACPMAVCARGQGKRWCHFAFETDDAPPELLRLSDRAGLPKARATASFLFMAGLERREGEGLFVRIISDAFPVPPKRPGSNRLGRERLGRYGCCGKGLVLLAGDERPILAAASGVLVKACFSDGARDPKSGAPVAELAPPG